MENTFKVPYSVQLELMQALLSNLNSYGYRRTIYTCNIIRNICSRKGIKYTVDIIPAYTRRLNNYVKRHGISNDDYKYYGLYKDAETADYKKVYNIRRRFICNTIKELILEINKL